MTLHNISELRDPRERVPLSENEHYEQGLQLISGGQFDSYQHKTQNQRSEIEMTWTEAPPIALVKVQISEATVDGTVKFGCSHCTENGRMAHSCPHQWASYVLLWQVLTLPPQDIAHPELAELARELQPQIQDTLKNLAAEPVVFQSISIYSEEPMVSSSESLSEIFKDNFYGYRLVEPDKDRQLLSPRLWNLPEVFGKKLTAFSESYFNEVNRQNRLADMVRYNFSGGVQVSAKDILRHPLHRMVPAQLLPPTLKTIPAVFQKWPVLQQATHSFVTQVLSEVEAVMQYLLSEIASAHRSGLVEVYLQHKDRRDWALKLKRIDFDLGDEIYWRVDLQEKIQLETEFQLINKTKSALSFFQSFAVDKEDATILVHPWLLEFTRLQEICKMPEAQEVANNSQLHLGTMPRFNVEGEAATRRIIRELRQRPIPVKLSGESALLTSEQMTTEVHLQENGSFFFQHQLRPKTVDKAQKYRQRTGWSEQSKKWIMALSEGLPTYLSTDIKDLASGSRRKREWDLKLLRHLGILQYVFFETLSYYYDGQLTDGSKVEKERIFQSLTGRIHGLLTSGRDAEIFNGDKLEELCSQSTLVLFEKFIEDVLQLLPTAESFYSEDGEIVVTGIFEREGRILYSLIKALALNTGGEVFKRSRTSFLSRISDVEVLNHSQDLFYFSTGERQQRSLLHISLEYLQELVPFGCRLYFDGQALQELEEDEFRVEFAIRGDTDQKNFNWFELDPKFFLLGEEVNPDHLLSLGSGGVIEYQGKLYLVPKKQIPSLRRLENFWQKLQKGKIETQKKNRESDAYQLPRHQTLELLALRASGVKIEGDKEWQRICNFYDNLGTVASELKISSSVHADLKPYQKRGVQWLQDLYQLRLGALLADDMGLGKTLQTLCFLEGLRDNKELGHSLIVVPSSLIFNWEQEVKKFTPEIPLEIFSSREKLKFSERLKSDKTAVVLVTYGLLLEHEEFFSEFKWKVLIFDEAQNIKNISSKRSSVARSLAAQFKICLTGTPMENHYGEFFSLVDLLVPGSLGGLEDFRKTYVNREGVSVEQISDLKLKIKPLLLRRTKKEILDQLPEKQETKISIAFEEKQKEIYRDIALAYNQRVQEAMENTVQEGKVQGTANVQLQMLTALLRLRQACSDPAALPNVKYDKVPPKLETLIESLQEIIEAGESALVFTQFLQTLEHTTKLLKAHNIPVYVLHGGVTSKQRQKVLSDFHELNTGGVLLMTLKTGGVGLNLTKASYVFHLEPWWNPAVENQATDRAHRLGQKKAVQVFKYIMHESLEEKIELLKARKEQKFQSLLSENVKDVEIAQSGHALSKEEFDMLLGII